MNWQETCQQTYLFHKAQLATHGQAKDGRPPRGGKEGWSIRDTAKALNISTKQVVEDIKLFTVSDLSSYKKLDRKEALFKLAGKELPPTPEKVLKESILSALAWLKGSGKRRVDEAIKILEKSIE
jgi:hypothetical protein